MSEGKIEAALSVRLNELALPTEFINAKFTPPVGVIYLKESFLRLPTISVGVAAQSSDQHDGIYQVMVMAPKDTGKSQGIKTADIVAEHFKKTTTLTREGVKVVCLRSAIGVGFPVNDRFAIPVDVRYRAFT